MQYFMESDKFDYTTDQEVHFSFFDRDSNEFTPSKLIQYNDP